MVVPKKRSDKTLKMTCVCARLGHLNLATTTLVRIMYIMLNAICEFITSCPLSIPHYKLPSSFHKSKHFSQASTSERITGNTVTFRHGSGSRISVTTRRAPCCWSGKFKQVRGNSPTDSAALPIDQIEHRVTRVGLRVPWEISYSPFVKPRKNALTDMPVRHNAN